MHTLHKSGGQAARRLIAAILLMLIFVFPTAAESTADIDEIFREQATDSGGNALLDTLPEETRNTLAHLGITELDANAMQQITPDAIWDTVWLNALNALTQALPIAGVILGILILCSLLEGMRHTADGGGMSDAMGIVGILATGGAVLPPLVGCLNQTMAAAESASVYMTSFVPVYAGVMVSTGQVASAASYQTVMLFAAQAVTALLTGVVVPLLIISLAMGMTGSLAGGEGVKLDSLSGSLRSTATWILVGGVTLFTGLLTLQSIVGGAADSMTLRTAKLSVSSAVPIVGGPLSEALSTVQGCLQLLKSTLGMFGVIATAGILLPPLFSCAAWSISLSFCSGAAEMSGLPQMAGMFKAAKGVMGTLIGVLAACGLLMIVGTTIVTMATAGG